MRKLKTLAAVVALVLATLVAAPIPVASAHTPTCHYGTYFPYMYTHKVIYSYGSPWFTYKFYYVDLTSLWVHTHLCKIFVA